MKVSNDSKGNIDGTVKLEKNEVHLILNALSMYSASLAVSGIDRQAHTSLTKSLEAIQKALA